MMFFNFLFNLPLNSDRKFVSNLLSFFLMFMTNYGSTYKGKLRVIYNVLVFKLYNFSFSDIFILLIFLVIWTILFKFRLLFSLFFLPEIMFILNWFIIFYYILLNYIKSFFFNMGREILEDQYSYKISFNFILNSSIVLFLFLFVLIMFLYTNLIDAFNSFTFYYFFNSLNISNLSLLIKLILSFFSLSALYIFRSKIINSVKEEYILIFLLTILFAFFLLSSSNFIPFFISLEGFSMSIIILLIFDNSTIYTYSNSLRYLIINGFASLLILLGIFFLYSIFGTFSFKLISYIQLIPFDDSCNLYLNWLFKFSSFLIFLGLIIKIGLAPFHTWVFSVYSNANYFVLLFLITSSKFVYFFIFYTFYSIIFYSITYFLSGLILFVSVVTIIIVSIISLIQSSLKLFLICSSLINSGFILISLLSDSLLGFCSFFFYIFIDCFFLSFLFSIFISNSSKGIFSKKYKITLFKLGTIKSLSYIKGFYYKFFISLILLTFSGLPPFLFFFAKYSILQSLLFKRFWMQILIFILLFSMINSYNYLRIIKNLFFFDHYPQKFYINNSSMANKINLMLYKDFLVYYISILLIFVSFFFIFFYNYFFIFFYVSIYF